MIGFAGLSHLGIVSSIAAASKGERVVAFDANADLTGGLSRGKIPFFEPGLDDELSSNRERMTFTSELADLAACDVIYISKDVPTDAHGVSDVREIEELFKKVSGAARSGATVVILSQVAPGFCRTLRSGIPESGAIELYYQVETLIFGNALHRALSPERYIVGSADPMRPIPAAFRAYLERYGCPILLMRYESAELAKISINLFLISSVVTTNTIAEVCEQIGADWEEIAPTLRLDKRIGPHAYLAPGLGIAGGNLERDMVTIGALSGQHGTESGILGSWQRNLTYRRDWVQRVVSSSGLLPGASIAVWGLAYKAGTDSIKNSPALTLLSDLHSYRVRAYDPKVDLERSPQKFSNVTQVSDSISALEGADALLVMTPWPEFSAVEPARIREKLAGRLVADPYRCLNHAACLELGLDHRQIGYGEIDER